MAEPLIPQYRLDYRFQKANDAIQASDLRFEIGKDLYATATGYRQLIKAGPDIKGVYVGFSAHY